MLLSSQVNSAALSAISSSVSLAERRRNYESNTVSFLFFLHLFRSFAPHLHEGRLSGGFLPICLIVAIYNVLSKITLRQGRNARLLLKTTGGVSLAHVHNRSCHLEMKGLVN